MSLLPEHRAPQHERAPRPLPLFLELVRRVAEREPDVARQALAGLKAYEQAERSASREPSPGATLQDHGGSGPPVVLVPSLINPPHVLDLDAETSLARAVAGMGRRTFLLDWGRMGARANLTVAGHVETLLVPLVRDLGDQVAMIGYCLGGTMAIAAADLIPVERVATLAAPWRFANYPPPARTALSAAWNGAAPTAAAFGALPMEVLQAAFWSLDERRTVAKFAEFAALDPGSAKARRFVALEDWANSGEPLPLPAARELIEDLFGSDLPGRGTWRVGGRAVTDLAETPLLHFTANGDRIVPPETAPRGPHLQIDAGHVGMVVGSARAALHAELARFLAPACR